MVVRDDEYYVDMAIKSVLPYINNLYILDNGSEDGTIEIIEAFSSDKIHLEKIKYDFPCASFDRGHHTITHPYWRYDEQYDGNSLEAQTRNICMRNCIETFNPDWLIQIDADEVFTKLFFDTLKKLNSSNISAIAHSTDRFITEHHIARDPVKWDGDIYDPHRRSWKANVPVKWIKPDKGNKHVVPRMPQISVIMPQISVIWIDGIVHIHLHRMFGPKSKSFLDNMDKDFYDEQMKHSKKVNFDWDSELPFVAEKWREWGGFNGS